MAYIGKYIFFKKNNKLFDIILILCYTMKMVYFLRIIKQKIVKKKKLNEIHTLYQKLLFVKNLYV